MSTWSTPLTFVSGAALTAAQLNSGRDNLLFLKGALDLLTGGTTADTGTTMLLEPAGAASTSITIGTQVTGDAFRRFEIRADGELHWLPGTSADVDIILDPLVANRRLTLKGQSAGVAASAQFAIELPAAPATTNTFFVWLTGDTTPRISLATRSDGNGSVTFSAGSGSADIAIYRSFATELTIDAGLIEMTGALNLQTGATLSVVGNQVVGPQMTGWALPTGTTSRSTFDTATVTTAALAQKVKALIEDLHESAGHGLLGF
jgi:hypothetical protein